MELSCKNIEELNSIASKLLITHKESRVFAIYGKMGVGKTTFIKSLCKSIKVKDIVNSPSFGIINEYKMQDNMPVYHFDFYRIKTFSEFIDLGCEEYFYSGHYCFIEWPEKIEESLPNGYIPVFIEENDKKRIIKF
ncbi:MAG: tRNA (adenosine(37)-N6)-threonylcarbamoyltransferase complex ATPase subunit type 1 TsaE [Bacteroidetes bacterium]|nr:tRNA (adenosine(37)-N6)-threonylcarbamoyltransferase complex ATPase subunit type 1 TsaE [Bacteroidota bacterium]